jgi:putative OPT family oligopeptide transporter
VTTPTTSPPAASEPTFSPYISPTESPKEFTIGAILLGVVLGLVFAASSIYLALKVSLTVSASIPIAVLSITIFRYISRAMRSEPATILQNNLVQTTGSAGESIAAGIAFTLPALLLLGYELPWIKVIAIGVVGGVLGVLFLVPLRRSLIVKEHGNLKYPECGAARLPRGTEARLHEGDGERTGAALRRDPGGDQP